MKRKGDARAWYALIHPEHVRLGFLSGNCPICAELRAERNRREAADLAARRETIRCR